MRIAGCGLSIADIICNHVDFRSDVFRRFASLQPGDGGLEPGKIIFQQELEAFAGLRCEQVVEQIVDHRSPDMFSVGGPAIVALILAAQLLDSPGDRVEFYGRVGRDSIGDDFLALVRRTPLEITHYEQVDDVSPQAYALADPAYDGGHGERLFISNIAAYERYAPADLPDSFFNADLVLFGSTACVPQIHDQLTSLTRRAKQAGAITILTTVYDFRSEKRNPGGRWPLGESDQTYAQLDLMIADHEEALCLSGCKTVDDAAGFFIAQGVASFVITRGAEPVTFYSNGNLFAPCPVSTLSVSEEVGRRLKDPASPKGDTTGCGDNFCGGVIASLAEQLKVQAPGRLDLRRAVAYGICAGGRACFQLGGLTLEDSPGQVKKQIGELYQHYCLQMA